MADTQELTTEEKAALIGKTVEEKPEKEVVPDYDVTEYGGEETLAVEGEEDKRLGKTKDSAEHKQLSNREKRQLRKKRLAEKFDAKDSLIKQQAEQLNALAARLNDVEGKFSQVDQQQLVQAWNETSAAFQAAEKKHAEAFSNGDGAAATAAMRDMYVQQKRMDELQAINAKNQNVQKQPINKPDTVVVNRALEWGKENPWFKPGGNDEDSAIADTIAAKLVKDGFDPKSEEYWDELDERLEKRGIGYEDDEQDQSQSQRERQIVIEKPIKRKSPPIGGGSGRGDLGNGKVAITLPTAYINTLKDNGYWEDKTTRDRMIKHYLDGQKQREAEGNR